MSQFTARKDNQYEGFTITFANGCTISVQYGNGNYSTRNDEGKAISAEIAIWDKDRTWYVFDNSDTVLGHQTADKVAEWIRKASAGEIEFESELKRKLKSIKSTIMWDKLEGLDKLADLIETIK